MSTRSFLVAVASLLSAVVSPVAGQLTTSCNPLNATCPADPALGTAHTFYFNATPPAGTFNTTAGTVDYNFDTGAAFTISKKGESPTLISNFYFFFGRTEVFLKAAPGTGVISSIVWSSDVLDEVDWEFMGGNTTHVSSNYFGKGLPDFHNAQYHLVDGGVQDDYHNYTCVWTKDQLEWYIDSKHTRTLLAKDANNTLYYPQTPMKLSLGIWAGGDPDQPQGTIEWAGGVTDYSEPYTMYVKSALVQDYSTGKEYSYGDNSGTWESIKIASGNSTAVENINKQPEKSLSEKWNDLPSSTKNGVYAAAGGVGAIAFIALVVFGLRQRRRGKQEAALLAQRQEQERVELERFKREGRDPDSLAFDGTEYKGAMASTAYGVPDSPPGSSAGPPEKAWDPTGPSAVGAGTGAAMPLLRDDAMSQRVGSPAPGSAGPQRNNSFPAPIRTQSHGQPPQIPAPTPISPVNRTFSPSNASMRMGSPGPQAGGYGSPRINSPAPGHGPGSPASPRPGYAR